MRRYDGDNPDPSKWSPAMRAQIAAHLDGDGCLNIYFDKERKIYRTSFTFAGSSKLPLLLAEMYGGTASPKKSENSFVWVISKQEYLASMLKAIKPYVLLKRRHVEVALKALKIQIEKKSDWKDRLAPLEAEMHQLNNTKARGKEGFDHWDATDPAREG